MIFSMVLKAIFQLIIIPIYTLFSKAIKLFFALLYLAIVKIYFLVVPENVREQSLIKIASYIVVCSIVLTTGIAYLINPSALATLIPQNFINNNQIAVEGLEIYKYETESLQEYDTVAEFNSTSYSAGQFEIGQDDLEAYVNTPLTDELLSLNHYGANRPNIIDNGNWWNDDGDTATKHNWRYRQCFDIDYTAGVTNLTEYQLYLDFDTVTEISAGRMQSGGEDIRIVDASGNVIDHYIADEINTNNTRIWIQPDTINAGVSTNYCLYYGNPTATSTSNKDSVFTYSNPEDIYYALARGYDGEILEVGSYTDSNALSFNASSETLDEYDIFGVSSGVTPDPLVETQGVATLGPVQPTFSTTNTESFIPASNAGTQFVYRMDRNNQEFNFLSPYCDADIEIRNSANAIVTGGSITVTQGTSSLYTEVGPTRFGADDTAIIESTNGCPFLVSGVGDTGNDSLIMFPAQEEWYGVGSGNLQIAALEDDTDVFIYGSDNYFASYTVGGSDELDRGDNIYYSPAGSDGSDPAFRIVANKPVAASSLADSDGGETISFLPREQMGDRFIIPQDAQYIAIAGIAGVTTTVELWEDATQCGVGAPDETITMVPNVGNVNNPSKGYFGDTAEGLEYNAGACIQANHPISPYFERETGDDETQLYSWKQNRQYIHQAPTVSDVAFETGSWTLGTGSTFSNRIPVTITNNSASAIDEYNLPINLSNLTSTTNLDANAQTNGGDIRVAGPLGNGADDINYLLEEFDNAQDDGYLWIQSPAIAGSSTSTIYIYYNSNNTETTTSNPEATFTRSTKQISHYVIDHVAVLADSAYNIYSFTEDNEMDFRGINYTDFDAGTNYTLADDGSVTGTGLINQGDTVSVNGPITGSVFTNASDNLNPISFAGTKFLTVDTRDIDEYSLVAPFSNSTVTFERHDGTSWVAFGAAVNLTQNVVQNIVRDVNTQTGTLPGNSVRITSTTPILIHKHANRTATPTSDSLLLYPVEEAFEESSSEYILYGVNSNGLMLATENNPTTITIYYDDGTDSGAITVNAAGSLFYNEAGGATQGQGRGMKIVADGPIAAFSQADSDGNEASTFFPKKEFGTEFLFTTGIQYVSIVSNDPGTVCEIFDDSDTSVTSVTLSTNSSTYVNQGELGSFSGGDPAQYQAGYYMICDDPVFAYFEKNGDDSDGNITDETSFLTFAQGRKKAEIEPIVTDIDDLAVLEEGLYYESGFDMDTAASEPEAFTEFIFDSTDTNVAWNSIEITESTFDNTAVTLNNVDKYKVEVSGTTSANCATAIYPAYVEATVPDPIDIIELPDEISDNNCIRVRLTLRSGDNAHSPVIDKISLSYYNPVLLEDVLNTPTITMDASDSDARRRILKYTTSNLNLGGSISYLRYLDSLNNSVFSNLDLSLVDINTTTEATMFDWPPFPVAEEDSANTLSFDDTGDIAVYMQHDRTLLTGTSSVDMALRVDILNNSGTIVDREFQIVVNQ